MSSDDELIAWRKRMRIARRIANTLASGRQVWMRESNEGVVLYESPVDRGPGLVVSGLDRRTGIFAIRYRIVGLALADVDGH